MRSVRPAPMLLVLLAAGACDGDPVSPAPQAITELPRDLSAGELTVIEGSNHFAFDLLGAVRATQPDSPNTFLSPLSASMALGMTLNGGVGPTWSQMAETLGFGDLDETGINEAYRDLIDLLLELDPAVEFAIGNAIWADRRISLLDDFVQRANAYFDAEAATLDFTDPASRDIINGWVDDVTNGRIDTLIEQIPPDVLMYLVNAIYFKGDWRDRFDRKRTAAVPFTRPDGTQVTVDMMQGEVGHRVLNAGSHDAVQGVELPYGGGAYAAIALLPPESQPIDRFVAELDPADWAEWMDRFDQAAAVEDTEREGILVRLPKFELEWGDSLQGPLKALGMVDAFDEHAADFSRMTGARDLFIEHVIQKTFVRVDEEGTEAAAATAVGMGPTSLPPSVTFDRPFVFAIRERFSGTILFLGVIGDPSGRG